jgi:hypothetical protein
MSSSLGRCIGRLGALVAATAAAVPIVARGAGPVAEVRIGGLRARAWASSTLPSRDGRYDVRNLFDGRPDTSWVKGSPGHGIGEAITVELARPATVAGYVVVPGYGKSLPVFADNLAPSRLRLTADGDHVVTVDLGYVRVPGDDRRCAYAATPDNYAARVVVFRQPVSARTFVLTVTAVADARDAHHEDLAISEWTLLVEREGALGSAPVLSGETARAVAFLRRLARAGRIAPSWLAPGASVEDLAREHPLVPDDQWAKVEHWLRQAGVDRRASALQNYSTVAYRAFVGTAVAITASSALHLVGSRVALTGTEEDPVAVHPIVDLRDDGKIRRLRTSVAMGRCDAMPEASAGL